MNFFYTNKDDGNIAFHVNDDKNNVQKNRLLLSKTYNFDISHLRYMNQTHGDNIQVVSQSSKFCLDNCDALITNELNLPLMVMVADCIPILMYDEKKKVIAAIHAGRNSTFLNIAKKTALKMNKLFACNVKDIKVNLGPSIQKCCYEVSKELEDIVIKSFGSEFTNNRYINLQEINKKQLVDIGLKKDNITISSICTKCSNENYFSYRQNNKCGRFAGVITLS